MKKNVFGRQLKRDTNERKALFKSLLSSLILHHRIRTTEAKAKAIKGVADKIVTLAKRNSYLLLRSYLTQEAVQKFTLEIAPRFVGRQGGYTRIIRLEKRLSDNAQMVLIEWVEESEKLKVQNSKLEEEMIEGKKLESVTDKKPTRGGQKTKTPLVRKSPRIKKEKAK